MRILTYLILLILSINKHYFHAQVNFYSIYADNGFDYGEGISQAKDSSYYITGSSSSFAQAPSQMFILHTDTTGNYLWSKAYGGSENDIGKRIFTPNTNTIYVTGFTNSFSNGSYDFSLLKTDNLGNQIWLNTYGGESNEILHDAIILPDTSFLLVGQSTSNDTQVEDIQIMRINKAGELIWSKQLGKEGIDIAWSVQMIDTNNIIIGGESYINDSTATKAYLSSITSRGEINWEKTYGNNGEYKIFALAVDSNHIYGVGYQISKGNTNKTYFTLKTDIYGENSNEILSYQNGSNYYSQIVKHGPFNNHYLASQPKDNDILPTYSEGEDLQICRYTYELNWATKCVNPSSHGDDHCNQLIATNDLGAIAVGHKTQNGKGGASIFILKIGPYDQFPDVNTPTEVKSLVSIQKNHLTEFIELYPNPSSDKIHIKLSEGEIEKIEVINLKGQTLLQKDSNIYNSTSIEINSFEKGVYFLKILTSKGIVIQKIMKE